MVINQQDSVSFRINRSGNKSGAATGQAASFEAYLYHLNRYHPVCESAGICSVTSTCTSTSSDPCYGGGDPQNGIATPRGRWVTLELWMQMNDPGQKNGCAAVWVDGTKTKENCGYDFGRDKGWLIQGYYGYSMWHCDGSPKAQKWWLSNIRMYSN